MAITNPAQLKFVAEGIRPAADKLIGGYDSCLLMVQAWGDADDAGKLALWPGMKKLCDFLGDAYIDADRLSKP